MEKQRQQSPPQERARQTESSAQVQAKQTQTKQTKPKRKRKKRSTGERVLFFSFKWTLILFCLFISVIAGLIFGYSIIGDGKAGDVFDLRMWKHIYDLVFST